MKFTNVTNVYDTDGIINHKLLPCTAYTPDTQLSLEFLFQFCCIVIFEII